MSDYYDDDETQNGPKALRELVEKQSKELKKLQDDLAAEREARTKAEQAVKSTSLSTILRDKGVKPGLAKWLEKDEVEASPEAVDAWLKENGEFFNVKPAEPEKAEPQADEPQGESNVSPELEQALRAAQGLDASGVSPSEVDVIKKVMSVSDDPAKAGSYEDLVAALAGTGVDLA